MKTDNNKLAWPLKIDGQQYKWHSQFITGAEVKDLASLPANSEIFLELKSGETEQVPDAKEIDLKQPGLENFFHKKRPEEMVTIHINRKEYKVKLGTYKVSEIKVIGGVPPAYELEQLVNGELRPLNNNATVHIKGGEEFFGHPCEGKSS